MARSKVRKLSLDEMARKYQQSAVEEAGQEAESRKVRDGLAYMTKTLENGEPGNLKTSESARNGHQPGARKKSQVLCDGCGWPHWVDGMRVIGGQAYAKDCVPSSTCPLGAEVEERTGVSQRELDHMPREQIAYARSEPYPPAEEWKEKRNEITRQLIMEQQIEWPDMVELREQHGWLKAWGILMKRPPSKAGEKYAARINEQGNMPLRHWGDIRYTVGIYGPSQEMTPSARAVSAWWEEK